MIPILVYCGRRPEGAIFSKEYEEGTGHGLLVRTIPLKALEDFTKPSVKDATMRWKELGQINREEMGALLAQSLLLEAVKSEKRSELLTYARLQAGVEKSSGEQIMERLKSGHPVAEFCRRYSDYLSEAKFVPWWCFRTRRIEPGLHCKTLATGLFCLLLNRIVLPQGMSICTACGKVFRRARVGQRFCSMRCGNLVRQRRKRTQEHRGKK